MFETEGRFEYVLDKRVSHGPRTDRLTLISIVLLNMSMPELDGVGAATEIRKIESLNPSSKSTRILALTGMSTQEDKRRAFEAGVDG
jgi:CheY-like chemotaxis protein